MLGVTDADLPQVLLFHHVRALKVEDMNVSPLLSLSQPLTDFFTRATDGDRDPGLPGRLGQAPEVSHRQEAEASRRQVCPHSPLPPERLPGELGSAALGNVQKAVLLTRADGVRGTQRAQPGPALSARASLGARSTPSEMRHRWALPSFLTDLLS